MKCPPSGEAGLVLHLFLEKRGWIWHLVPETILQNSMASRRLPWRLRASPSATLDESGASLLEVSRGSQQGKQWERAPQRVPLFLLL